MTTPDITGEVSQLSSEGREFPTPAATTPQAPEAANAPLSAEQTPGGPGVPTDPQTGPDARTAPLPGAAEDAANPADAFNDRFPVGSPVIAYPGLRPDDPYVVQALKRRATWGITEPDTSSLYTRLVTRTRTPAWLLGHGEPVVSVDGYAGGIALTHIEPFGPLDSSPEAHAARNTPRNPHPLCRDFQPQPRPADFWCATCHWNRPMHDDETKRAAIADALKCLPEVTR